MIKGSGPCCDHQCMFMEMPRNIQPIRLCTSKFSVPFSLEFNYRAVEAVRQWRFAPGRMKGVPVDVVVEVGVEFRLR